MRSITVELGDRSYPIYLGREITGSLGEICAAHKIPPVIAIVTDTNVASLHLKKISGILAHAGFRLTEIIIPPGEQQKSIARANDIITKMFRAGLNRSSAVFAVGSGVVGDVAGFVAATFRRGIPIVQVPMTLLAQVESSIGGKVGVNHPLSKNAIGAFHQPKFVFSDVAFLSTLPRRELFCGLGELLKYAILDRKIFSFIDEHLDAILRLDPDITEEVIFRCNVLKAGLVSRDEREGDAAGGRAVLNLGHTIGHALENLSQYKLHHGEAVLLGLRWELNVARNGRIISESDFREIASLIDRVGYTPRTVLPRPRAILAALFDHKGGKPRFILPQAIGRVMATTEISRSLVQSVFAGKRQ